MRLRTLGGLALDGAAFRRPKPLLLVAYLAVEGPKDRRHLSELFWPAAADPMTSLRVALSQLRRGAPGALASEGNRLAATLESDAERVLTSLERGELAEAVRAYRGPFLDGFLLGDGGAELEEWVYGTREYLAETVREALLRLAEQEAAAGAFGVAAAHAESAYRLPGAAPPEPLALERLHTVLVAGGSPRAHDAQRDAAGYGLLLRLGIQDARARLAPCEALGGVRRGQHRLPVPTTTFVGRDPELLELSRLLAEPDTRLITIVGPGGVGKSRLAIQAAHGELHGPHFEDGVAVVALEALSDPDLIAATIAREQGVTLPDGEAPIAHLVEALRARQMLLVLDDFEQLMAGAVLLSELLEGCPDITLLVTSRERLNLGGEQCFVLEGLPLPEVAVGVADAEYHDAVRLFLQRARRAHLDFSLTAQNLGHVLTICRRVGGLPLAIELAAARVRMMSVAEIADDIERSLDLLSAGSRDAHERQHSVRATFEHSWKLLSEREQEAARMLSVFVGGFTREAASTVGGATIPLLTTLVDKSLLRVLEGGRFDRHPLLDRYTREKLAERPEERAAAEAAHVRYYLRLAEEAEAKHHGSEQVEWLERLEREHANLRAALTWALSGGAPELGLQLAVAMYHFWYYRSYLREGIEWLERALEVAATEPAWDAHRSRLLSAVGALANERGDDERARLLFDERLALARVQGDLVGQAAALNSLGIVAWGQQHYAEARELMEASLSVRREIGRPQPVAVSLNNLGLVALVQGDLDEARDFLEESLATSRGLGDEMGVAMSLANLAAVALEANDCSRAERLLHDAVPRYLALGDRTALGQCLENFATLAAMRGRPQDAARLSGAAEALRDYLGAAQRPEERARHERSVAKVRAVLDASTFAAAWEQGRGMALGEAIEFALAAQAGEWPPEGLTEAAAREDP